MNYNVKPKLSGKWYTDRRFKYVDDVLNIDKYNNIFSNLTMGKKSYWAPVAVFMVKPPCSIGFKVNDEEVIL